MARLLRSLALSYFLLMVCGGLSASATPFLSYLDLKAALTSGQFATETLEGFEGVTPGDLTVNTAFPLSDTPTSITANGTTSALGNAILASAVGFGSGQVFQGDLRPNSSAGNDVFAIVFDLPNYKIAWGADFGDDTASGTPDDFLMVELFNNATSVATYNIGAALSIPSGDGNGFFGSLETASFNKLVFTTVGVGASEGQAFQMDNLYTYVPEPSAAIVFAANFAVVGWITRRRVSTR